MKQTCILLALLLTLSVWCHVDIVLITQYYNETCRARQREMMDSLHENLNNSNLDKIHLLQYDQMDDLLPQQHPKLCIHKSSNPRLSFGEALRHVNEHLQLKIAIIANNDITFDKSLHLLREERVVKAIANKYSAFALSRIEPDEHIGIGSQCSHKYVGSHDAFVVHSPVPQSLILGLTNVYLGQAGADARFVYEARNVGLIVGNPCKDMIILHHHKSNHRTSGIQVEANLHGKSALAPPQTIDEFLDNEL